ncbi:ATP-grasp ribosomal peptide maturase [Allonocardiopsis opalescens]|uniref:ATP-grasp ribosomal peptide maturase n=1 Tax=Allonocardiopsis opalescens TaxID=1144618 RepID=A0A2T0Q9X5_9ACTN|nr:ATP-grasp ribosomal peptide maturase [Allonocardiopsis opalescens]PRY00664.1 ATP-grasp ribosomal peptide maturase [Allonocardiopsis opalescens]
MSERPVLVVTELRDATADLVTTELHRRGVPVVRLDPGTFPAEVELAATVDEEGLTGAVVTPTRRLALAGVRSVYWRRPSPYVAAQELTESDRRWVVEQSRWGLGGVLASLPGALYVNHPWHNRQAEHKVAQLAAAARCGFVIPRTLVTNDIVRARVFARRHQVVYKPLWNGEYQGDDGVHRAIWVDEVDADMLDESIGGAPHLLQARVDKQADIRTTVVGRQVFSVRIDGAPGLDWRSDYPSLTYTALPTPPPVRAAIDAYLDAFGLAFGAFDFALCRDGTWVFLECNPNGQWAWIEVVREPITTALADLLQKEHT